ncbi:nucleotidyltransferase domain-containing protein [Flavobacterium sp. CBA20B-1]|uniref:nucleotidyltransferase domain-containing protein n=1 Tax=unclassified Flavobacterium TaxID=196869 RepID=UPI002224BCAF|nr:MULTISPECIES: nucleotidyltransferase domain-containing protein [unclassified Flavobacterium]WCM42803.1 nucleotidyltransferase domain-containing protein [Flavobacterium sp. CBA20B-1]
MKKIIVEKLNTIEQEKGIKILFAIESGSRGWGFSSADSDYDVRFVYVRPKKDYLHINEQSDFLDFPINNELDINGWDVRKFLKLLYASNATPFEWMQSPIVYQKDESIFKMIVKVLPNYFCQQTLVQHYLGLVHKKIEMLRTENMRLKDFFYIYRSLLAARFALKNNQFPPMEFSKLMIQIDMQSLLNETKQLVCLKKSMSEKYIDTINLELIDYLENTHNELSESKKIKRKGTLDLEILNETFYKIVTDADNRYFKEKQPNTF